MTVKAVAFLNRCHLSKRRVFVTIWLLSISAFSRSAASACTSEAQKSAPANDGKLRRGRECQVGPTTANQILEHCRQALSLRLHRNLHRESTQIRWLRHCSRSRKLVSQRCCRLDESC